MFSYQKIKNKKYIRTCDECGGVKEVTFVHTKKDCNPISRGIDYLNHNYLNKTFGDMKIMKIYKKGKTYMCESICNVCSFVFETRLSNMVNNAFKNQSHKNCQVILYKQVDDIKKYQNFSERWRMMIRRCCDPSHKSYDLYSKYRVDERWKDFMNFYFDMYEGFEVELQIDRINGDKGYSKENCRWVTPVENSLNRKSIKKCFAYDLLNGQVIEFNRNGKMSLRTYIEDVLSGSSSTVYDRLNGKTNNKSPYRNHMFFNTKKELKDYLSVETKLNN